MAWMNRRAGFGGWKKNFEPKPWLLTLLTKPNFDGYLTEPRIIAVNEQQLGRKWDTNSLLTRREQLGEEESDSKYFLTYASDTSLSIRAFISKPILGGVAPSTSEDAEPPLSYSGEYSAGTGGNVEDVPGNVADHDLSAGNRRFDLLITKYKLRVHFAPSSGVNLYLVVDEGRKWQDRKSDTDFGFDKLCLFDGAIYQRMKKRFGDAVTRSWEIRTAEFRSSSATSSLEAAAFTKNAVDKSKNNRSGGDGNDQFYGYDQDGDCFIEPDRVTAASDSKSAINGNISLNGTPMKRDRRGNRIQSHLIGGSSEASQLLSALATGSTTSSGGDHSFSKRQKRTDDQYDDVIIIETRDARIQTDSKVTGFRDCKSIREAAMAQREDLSPEAETIDLTTPRESSSDSLDEIIRNTDIESIVRGGKEATNTVEDGNGDQVDVDVAQSGDGANSGQMDQEPATNDPLVPQPIDSIAAPTPNVETAVNSNLAQGTSSPKKNTRQARKAFRRFKLPPEIQDDILQVILMDE